MKRFSWLLLAPLFVAGCSGPDEVKALSSDNKTPTVKVVAAIEVNEPETIPILGAITAQTHSNIGAETDGRVTALLVKEGQHVHAGQALIQLAAGDEETRLDAAKGGLKQAVLSAQDDEHIASAKLLQATLDYSQTKDRLTSEVTLAKTKLADEQAHYDELKRGARPQEIEAANSDVVAAQSVVESDQSTVDFTKIILKRKSAVAAQGGLSQNEVDEAQLDYDHAVQAVAFAQQQLRAKQLYLNLLKEGTPKEELAQGAAELAGAKESLRAAQANMASLADAKQAVTMAQADHDRAEARLQQLLSGNTSDEGAKLQLAQADLERTQIKTPIDGIVSSIKVVKGQVAKSGQIVAEVVGDGGVQMEATALDEDIAKIHSGQHVDITLRDDASRHLDGVVSTVLPPGSEGRSSRIIVLLHNADDIASGSIANGEVETSVMEQGAQIPATTLFNQLNDEANVYVIDNDVVRRRPVRLGKSNADYAVALSGVQVGQQVVIRPPSDLHDGMAVKIEDGPGAHR